MRWKLAAGVYAVAVGVLSVIPVPPEQAAAVPWLDKALHVCEYLLLAWLWVRALGVPAASLRSRWLYVVLLSTAYGMLLEGVQAWLPYRSAEWADVAANFLGSAAGAWVGMWWRRTTHG